MRRGGADDAADLLQASLQVARRPLAAHAPQAVRQALGQVQLVVGLLPQVHQLKDVLPRRAGAHHRLHVFPLHLDPREAAGDDQQVVQGEVLQTVAAGHLPFTVVYTFTCRRPSKFKVQINYCFINDCYIG